VIVAAVAVKVAQFDSAGLPEGYDDFEITAPPRDGRGLDEATGPGHIVLVTRHPLPADPRQASIAIITVKMTQLDNPVSQSQRHDNLKITVLARTGRRLDDAAGSDHAVLVTRDSFPAGPGQVDVAVVARPVPQLSSFYDDCLKITVAASPKVGLNETDINSGHLNSPFQSSKLTRLRHNRGLRVPAG
jgi:hypothetical protein